MLRVNKQVNNFKDDLKSAIKEADHEIQVLRSQGYHYLNRDRIDELKTAQVIAMKEYIKLLEKDAA